MPKKYLYLLLLLALPLLFAFDMLSFMLSKVTCLTCDLSNFFQTSSLAVTVSNHAWQLLRKQS